MPKQKTHKGYSKRVKVTGSGKIKRNCCNGGHLMSGKTSKNRRKVKGTAMVTGVRAAKIRILLNA